VALGRLCVRHIDRTSRIAKESSGIIEPRDRIAPQPADSSMLVTDPEFTLEGSSIPEHAGEINSEPLQVLGNDQL
jgi:hypothetical protein